MSYFPIDVEGVVRRNTLGSRANDPQIPSRPPRRFPRLRSGRRRRAARTSVRPQPQRG
jgi:hypothetical protein